MITRDILIDYSQECWYIMSTVLRAVGRIVLTWTLDTIYLIICILPYNYLLLSVRNELSITIHPIVNDLNFLSRCFMLVDTIKI